jgi:hypothetical protein
VAQRMAVASQNGVAVAATEGSPRPEGADVE